MAVQGLEVQRALQHHEPQPIEVQVAELEAMAHHTAVAQEALLQEVVDIDLQEVAEAEVAEEAIEVLAVRQEAQEVAREALVVHLDLQVALDHLVEDLLLEEEETKPTIQIIY